MEIKLVKLISGDCYIANYETKEPYAYLHKPAQLIMSGQGPALIPFHPLGDKEEVLEVRLEHVVWTAKLVDDAISAYNSEFGNGLVVPPKSLIL